MFTALIVEDNDAFRKMLKEVLLTRFPKVSLVEEPDGSELFSRIATFHPNIVFMDIGLPGESGLELTRRIKIDYPDIIVIILTSYDLPEYRQAAIKSKADYFISKDSSPEDFLALVESILTQKQSYHQKRPS